jgi:hypothetical protein
MNNQDKKAQLKEWGNIPDEVDHSKAVEEPKLKGPKSLEDKTIYINGSSSVQPLEPDQDC